MRRAIVLLFAVASAPPASAPAPADAAATVWAVPSIRKVRPDDPVERANRVWSAETRTVSVAGARGEHVPFQLVLTVPPPPNRHERAAAGFFVEASDLVSERGRIPRERVELFLEHVVLCYARSSPIGATGFGVYHYPDVPPECRPLAESALVQSVQMTQRYVTPMAAAQFLVGELVDEAGRPSFMLVNKDLAQSFQFAITLRKPGRLIHVSPYSGQEEAFAREMDWIAPGAGHLFRVE